MKARSNLHVQVARARLSNNKETEFKTKINNMNNINQKGNIENAIKAAANTAKTARNTKRVIAIQRTKNEAAKAAKEAAELKAKGNIAKARIEAAKEAAAEAQRKRNEKRKQKFENLLTQFNKDINNSQKTKFRQRFNMAQEQRKLPMESRSNNASRMIENGGLAKIAAELRKIKANKNEAAHKAAVEAAKAAGSANEVARQKTAYLQKRQASFNKMIQNAKNRHSLSSNQRPVLNMVITNLTAKFNRGQEERKKNGPQNQTIINAGKIPELAKAIRELENEFIQKQRNKNAQNIKNAQKKAKKAEANRNQAQIQSKKYKEQSEKYKKRKNALVQNIKKVVETRNAARQELEQAKKNLATASTQSEDAQKQAKAKLEAAQEAAKAAQNELAKSKNASKLANKKRELTNLAREQRVLQNLAPNGLTPNGFGPRRPFSRIINGLTVNDLANGGLAGKLPNQIKATGTAKKANQNAKKKAEMEAAEKRRQEKQETKRKQREAAAAKAKANQEKREKQKESVIESIKKAQNASKAKALRERLNKMKTIITEKRAKENRIKKECASNPYLEQCGEGAIAARKKAAEKKAYKQKLTNLLNSYNNRLGDPSWPGKKNELFKKYANTITNDKVIKAELNSMTKIRAEKTTGQRKKEITKLLNSYNNKLGSKKWPETKGVLLNKYMKSTKNLEQDKASLEALLKLKVQAKASKKAANNLAAKKVTNNLAAKKVAMKKARSELTTARIEYRQKVAMAGRDNLFPTAKELDDWNKPGRSISFDASTITGLQGELQKLQGYDKMLNTRLNELKRGKNAATKIQAAFKGAQVRKSVGGSSMGQDILKKHISGVNVMAGQKIPGFSGKRVETGRYERDWLKRVDEEGDTAVKRAKLRKMFDDKFELKKKLLTNESSNVRREYTLGGLQALKKEVMRPRISQKQSTKGTNQNVAILNVARINKEIEEARSRYNARRIKASMNKMSTKYNNPTFSNNKMPKNTKSSAAFNMKGGFNGGIRLGSGGNKAINGVNMTLKRAKPSLKNITQNKIIRPARMASQMKPKPAQGPTVMKLGVQAAAAKNKLGKPMTNAERRVAARKAAEATGRLGGRMAQQRNNTFREKGMTAAAIAKANARRAEKAAKKAAKKAK